MYTENAEYIGGFHLCYLDQPIHIQFASESFCAMTHYSREEIHERFQDKLIGMVHPDDRDAFRNYVRALIQKEQTLTLRYRIIRKDGSILYVSDTQTSKRMDDGHLYGFGVVADITPYMETHTGSEPLLPYGIMKCTADKYPRIKYINENMETFLRVAPDKPALSPFARDNIYFLLPFEERDLFRDYLEEAMAKKTPIGIEHSLLRGDGSVLSVMGWVSYTDDELTFIYMQISPLHEEVRKHKENSYYHALKSAYNAMFEINLVRHTVECIHDNGNFPSGNIAGICMTPESLSSYWIERNVLPRDRDMTRDYLKRICTPGALKAAGRPLQVEFSMLVKDGAPRRLLFVAVELDRSIVLLCCRDTTEVKYGSIDVPSTEEGGEKEVFIRTFGYFDVFAAGKAVRFTSEKEKELLAILVDRKGGNVSGENAISLLWEDEPLTPGLRTRYRKLAMGLKNTLERYGIADIVSSEHGIRHLNVNAVYCDYYEALGGSRKYRELFSGVYMQNYSWAEETLGLLLQIL